MNCRVPGSGPLHAADAPPPLPVRRWPSERLVMSQMARRDCCGAGIWLGRLFRVEDPSQRANVRPFRDEVARRARW